MDSLDLSKSKSVLREKEIKESKGFSEFFCFRLGEKFTRRFTDENSSARFIHLPSPLVQHSPDTPQSVQRHSVSRQPSPSLRQMSWSASRDDCFQASDTKSHLCQ